jgi:hypothetical protein
VTVGGENLVSKTLQLRHISSQTWQERRSSGKRGKSDVNVARETLTWQERHQRSKTDVIGQHEFFFFKFPLFCDNMDNFVHNTANKTSEFLQYVLVLLTRYYQLMLELVFWEHVQIDPLHFNWFENLICI